MTSIPPATLFENALYVGINVQGILYGIELVLYFKTMRIYVTRRRNPRKSDAFYAVFSTVMFLMVTIWVVVISILGQKMWLLDRTYPGGPMAVVSGNASHVLWDFMTTSTIVLQQMTDGLMVYRCGIVWESFRVIIIPSFLWFATLVIGIVAAATIGPNPLIGIPTQLSLVFYTTSVFLSTTMSCMICYWLLHHAKRVEECLGRGTASPYFITVAFIVESVLPYTLSGIAFLVSYGMMSQTGMGFLCVYTLMMCISPQILILRVAERNARQTNTIRAPASMIMTSPDGGATSGLSRFDGGEAIVMHLQALSSVDHLESVEDSDKV